MVCFQEKIEYQGGGYRTKIIPSKKSPYYRMFLEGLSYRPSCYQCQYSTINKPADITLGDYFEARDDYPELYRMGAPLNKINDVSSVLIHSPKGWKIFHMCEEDLEIFEVDTNKVQMSHQQLCMPFTCLYHKRKKIFNLYNKGGFRSIRKYYFFIDMMKSIRNIIYVLFSNLI